MSNIEPQNPKPLLALTESFVRARLAGDAGGHDFAHIERVRAVALRIAADIGADLLVTEMAALLHDVTDPKLNASPEAARKALEAFLASLASLDLDVNRVDLIRDVVARVSFGGELPSLDSSAGKAQGNLGGTLEKPPELMAVQDADRLDALGAIGIARAFAYGGSKGQAMHDPELPPRLAMDAQSYRNGKSTSVNHFHEKLFKLKDRMNTRLGRELAEERHAYMRTFLERFQVEWRGE